MTPSAKLSVTLAFGAGNPVIVWITLENLNMTFFGRHTVHCLPMAMVDLGPVHTRQIELQLKLISKHLSTIFEMQSTLNMVG